METVENFLKVFFHRGLSHFAPVENLWIKLASFPQAIKFCNLFPQLLYVFHRFFPGFSTENRQFSTKLCLDFIWHQGFPQASAGRLARLIRSLSCLSREPISGSVRCSSVTFSQLYITVVWSLPPNSSPILGKLNPVY